MVGKCQIKSLAKIILVILAYMDIITGMKIGVLSDTHLKGYDNKLKEIAEGPFRDAKVIMHAGDIVEEGVLDAFGVKDVYAVRGNMDSASLRNALPEKRVVEILGLKIGLMHGWGEPFAIEKRILNEFSDIDCLVYGHTHRAVNRVKNGLLIFNPGSAAGPTLTGINSVGILEIDNNKIWGRIINLD